MLFNFFTIAATLLRSTKETREELKPFLPNAPFLYPLCFQGTLGAKGALGTNGSFINSSFTFIKILLLKSFFSTSKWLLRLENKYI